MEEPAKWHHQPPSISSFHSSHLAITCFSLHLNETHWKEDVSAFTSWSDIEASTGLVYADECWNSWSQEAL